MKRGDIFLARVPHASATAPKLRPALVVQSDFYNQRIANVLVATITTNLSRQSDRGHFLIDVSTPEGQLSGLRQNSLISCLNLAVIPPSDIGAKVGELPPTLMRQINDCLRFVLDL